MRNGVEGLLPPLLLQTAWLRARVEKSEATAPSKEEPLVNLWAIQAAWALCLHQLFQHSCEEREWGNWSSDMVTSCPTLKIVMLALTLTLKACALSLSLYKAWANKKLVLSVVVQLLSHVQFFVTPWTAACQASLAFTISRSLLKLVSIESVMPSNHLILCHPLLLLPSIFPRIRVFSNEFALHVRWQKYWSFSFIISPSNDYSELISFMIDLFDLLAVQRTLKSLL